MGKGANQIFSDYLTLVMIGYQYPFYMIYHCNRGLEKYKKEQKSK